MATFDGPIHQPFGKTLILGDDGKPLAIACQQCGRFALDTDSGLCARCHLHGDLHTTLTVLGNAAVLKPRA